MANYYSNVSNGYRLRLTLTPGTQSVTDNTTVVAWSLALENNSYNRMMHYSTFSVTIDGTVRKQASGAEFSANINAHSTISLGSGSFTTTHNPDGTRKIPFSASFKVNEIKYYTPQTTLTLSGSMALTTIARATVPVMSEMTMGVTSRINLPRASTAFTHEVYYSLGNASGVIGTGIGAYVNWTPPLSIANYVTNSTYGNLRIDVKTYDGTKLVGTIQSVYVRINVPKHIIPKIDRVDIANDDSAIQEQFGGLVRHQSKAKVTIYTSYAYSSPIMSVAVKLGGRTYTGTGSLVNIVTDTLTMAAGTYTKGVEVTVTDARGRTAIKHYPITILNWYSPKIISFSGFRINDEFQPDDSGTNAYLMLVSNLASIDKKNIASALVEVQDPVTKDWTEIVSYDLPIDFDGDWMEEPQILDGSLSPDNSYLIRATISDYFETVTQYFTLQTSANVVDFKANKKGVAIGKASEQDALEVAWDAHYTGDKLTHKGHDVVLKPEIDFMQFRSPVKYLGSTITDLNTTLIPEFLGYFTNGPSDLAGFIYFNQQFYGSVSVNSSRRQFAQSYTDGRMFTRVKLSGQPFSPWRELVNETTGTWTPSLEGTTGAGTAVYNSRSGTYYKIGKMVHVVCEIDIASWSGGSGYFIIKGLPFASRTFPLSFMASAVGDFQEFGAHEVRINGATAELRNAAGSGYIAVGNFSDRRFLYFSGTYITN